MRVRQRRWRRSTGASERRSGSPHHQRVVYSRIWTCSRSGPRSTRPCRAKRCAPPFADAVEKWGEKPALHWKDNGDWRTLTWSEYRDEVAAVTVALRALGFGPGQFGLIMARNAPEHVIADLGIVHAGGAAISVYNTLAPEQIEYVANHSEATVAFVEDEGFLEKFLAIRSSTRKLRHLVLVRGDAPEGVLTWESLLARGRELYAAEPKAFEESWRAVGPEDTVSLIYTSGTTGPPKGVVYSHNNIIWTLESVQRFWPIEPQTLVSYLPLAHVAERFTSQWRGIALGHEVWLCPDPNQLLPFLVEARPTFFVGVPRVWEKLMAGLRAGIAAEPDEAKRQMVQGAHRGGHLRLSPAARGQACSGRTGRGGRARAAPVHLAAIEGRPRPVHDRHHFDSPLPAGGARVLGRVGHASVRGVGHERADGAGDGCAHGRPPGTFDWPSDAGRRGAARRGRRIAGPRRQRHGRLLQRTGQDLRHHRRRGVGSQRRHRRARAEWPVPDHRPQEGADHYVGGQEHLAGKPRVAGQVQPDHRPGRRRGRFAKFHLRPGGARPSGRAGVGKGPRHRSDDDGRARRRTPR